MGYLEYRKKEAGRTDICVVPVKQVSLSSPKIKIGQVFVLHKTDLRLGPGARCATSCVMTINASSSSREQCSRRGLC